MPDALWIDRSEDLPSLARELAAQPSIGLDTEFLRERTFFPKLCLLQLCAGGRIWCIDTLRVGPLEPLMAALTAPATPKLVHAARQDLEAIYLTAKQVPTPVFDTQVAAACVGLKPQIGYADLVKTLLGVIVAKGQTRTDWSKRPLTREQLDYAAEDVLHLGGIAARLGERLRELGREHWAREDCAALQNPRLYEPNVSESWQRLRGIAQLDPRPRALAKAVAVWREHTARERNLPRAWILSDAAIFSIAYAAPADAAALHAVQPLDPRFNAGILAALQAAAAAPLDESPPLLESRPTAAQKALMERLNQVVDTRASQLEVSAEVLAPRGELKSLAMGKRDSAALAGWRLEEIGKSLLEVLG